MPGKKYKSLTVNKKVYEKMDLSSEKVAYMLQQNLDEKEKLRKFASKITKVPETVRVYSPSPQKEKK